MLENEGRLVIDIEVTCPKCEEEFGVSVKFVVGEGGMRLEYPIRSYGTVHRKTEDDLRR